VLRHKPAVKSVGRPDHTDAAVSTERIYLDYNATAPLRPEARAAMADALDTVGNASSVHAEGRAARAKVEVARGKVARLVGGEAKLTTFTSGGTEANNTVLTPDWSQAGKPRRFERLLIGATEHPSVLAGGRFPSDCVRTIPVNPDGIVDRAALKSLLAEQGANSLVSVMLANNETGVIQPVNAVAAIAHAAGALVHTDATQAVGRIPVDIGDLGADLLTLSAHKIGGPQGAGAIVRREEDLTFAPLLTGGGQERRARAGTENVAAIAGFGAAAMIAAVDLTKTHSWSVLRDEIGQIIAASGRPVTIFGENAARLPQTLCLTIAGVSAETLVIALDLAGIAVSSGAACSSGKVAPSHVLAAMGVEPRLAHSAIRISLGWDSKKSDLDVFSKAWRNVVRHIAPGDIEAV
jgi:cysteine desulfurase